MSIYIVTNGWQGNGAVACIVEANSDEEAKAIAQKEFLAVDQKYINGELQLEHIALPYYCEIG